ncbi:unnamed protein product [Durusdinium trenchii]|uniref:Protein kinase domain-containing protein n=1 Tax=Durusdinium trenchii TaxID=1381693 RepID=A0ABP0R8X8_9DINO
MQQDGKADAVQAIDNCLRQRLLRSTKVMFFFHRHARHKDKLGRRSLDLSGAISMTADLARHFALPDVIFSNLPETFSSFDFTGSGMLCLEETRVMVKKTLLQWRWALSGGPAQLDGEFVTSTLEDGGYSVVREMGRGGQGIMYLARKTEESSSWFGYLSNCGQSQVRATYCIKFYSKKNANAGGLQEILEEFHRMKEFDNVHVARTFEAFHDQDFVYLVNEPYFGGDFTKLAKRAYDKGVEMRESWWRDIFRQCLEGLEYLHREAQMHCDIKEPNLMIRHDDDFTKPEVVLIDFGLAQNISVKVTGLSGTPGYIPPETWRKQRWQPQGDIFSLGVVFFQLMSARVPRSGLDKVQGIFQEGAKNVQDVGQLTVTCQPPWKLFPTHLRLLTELVSAMLRKDPEQRPRALQALQYGWFFSTSDQELPKDTLGSLISGSAKAFFKGELINELLECCNLRELRKLKAALDAEASRRFSNQVRVITFRSLMADAGVQASLVEDYIRSDQGSEDLIGHDDLLSEAVQEKELRNLQAATNLFNEMDHLRRGYLPLSDIKAMLRSDAFERTDSVAIHSLLEKLRVKDGYVSLAEFQRVMLEDGCIAPKNLADQGQRPRRRDAQSTCFWTDAWFDADDSSSDESG